MKSAEQSSNWDKSNSGSGSSQVPTHRPPPQNRVQIQKISERRGLSLLKCVSNVKGS